ncbi:MAG TPA: DUF885 family protein, partial [Candidatus Acidoferrales bacterium]|nr:DUF885 family protein [Candidatus Acidoferrales bacterium]
MKAAAIGFAAPLIAIVLLGFASVATTVTRAAEAAPPNAAQFSTASADAGFEARVAEFVESEMRLYPQFATALGDHRFDNEIDNLSARGIGEIVAHARKWSKVFGGIDVKALSPAHEADREWLLAHLDGELPWNEQLRNYERDPGMFLPTAAVNGLIKREFAPLDQRMRSVTAREIAALKNLQAARKNLKPARTPKIAIEIALQQMPATQAYFKHDVPEAFAKVGDGADKRAFVSANANLAAAIEGYAQWLKADLEPKAAGEYAIGADAYRRMLNDADMVDIPLDRLEQVGEDELARLQNEFTKTAAQIDSKHSPADVVRSLAQLHPSATEVLPTVAAGLADLRDYVVGHHLASVPSNVLPLVRETPPYMRATTFASMDSPGPFEKTSEAFFYV